MANPPLIQFEDEHLLVIHKPAGWNTHSPSPYAGEGVYEWLKNREARWRSLAIIHRLDKETSGLLVFGKTAAANKSLTGQFERREVRKTYVLLTDRPGPAAPVGVQSCLIRSGDHYLSRPTGAGEAAETKFSPARPFPDAPQGQKLFLVEAEPVTGKTHQIRVHAADSGFPVFGDTHYGGTPAARVYLHAARLRLAHPVSGEPMDFSAEPDFLGDPRRHLREAIIDPKETTAWRIIHGAADGWPGLWVDRLGDYLLAQSAAPLTEAQREKTRECARTQDSRGAYHQLVERGGRSAPTLLEGNAAPAEFTVRENGVTFALRFEEGCSTGLFLDQRDNRRRLLTRHIGPGWEIPQGAELLNTFAYACAFSVCAAQGGARVTSLDLSKNYLEWGRRNFALNGLDPASHDFIFGDAFEWFRRLARKGRLFDVVILDPPTFSRSRESGVFRAEKDYGNLAAAALPLLKRGGILLASANTATLAPEAFLAALDGAVAGAGRRWRSRQYAPQPPDFPINRAEPAHLKTAWLQID